MPTQVAQGLDGCSLLRSAGWQTPAEASLQAHSEDLSDCELPWGARLQRQSLYLDQSQPGPLTREPNHQSSHPPSQPQQANDGTAIQSHTPAYNGFPVPKCPRQMVLTHRVYWWLHENVAHTTHPGTCQYVSLNNQLLKTCTGQNQDGRSQ